MAEADWDTVTVLRKSHKTGPTHLKSERAIAQAQRRGLDVETTKKYAAGSNKQHGASKNTAVLDRETEELHHDTVSLSVSKLIQQARQDRKMTQKDLAQKINEKPQVVNDYEAGRAVPNNQVMSKLERALGVRLRGANKGQPMGGPKK